MLVYSTGDIIESACILEFMTRSSRPRLTIKKLWECWFYIMQVFFFFLPTVDLILKGFSILTAIYAVFSQLFLFLGVGIFLL